ncbi:hypothetical protein Tco_0751673 [Tanacetum coccineum]|uniref:Uncharacterized protein n=1 Tax=Tanacetum coccineum TaxID=301880 RepID=A0ABQ4Z7K2_9ASTR
MTLRWATMTQSANLLSGFQKQFHTLPTTNSGLLPTHGLPARWHDGSHCYRTSVFKGGGEGSSNHEDALTQTCYEGPQCAVAFMANLSSLVCNQHHVNEEEHLDSDAETEMLTIRIPYHQFFLTRSQNVSKTEFAKDMLQRFNMPTHTIPMLSKKPKAATADLHKALLAKEWVGSTASEKPKVLASGMYTNSSKYIPPPKRANWVKPTPLPKKKQVTFQETPRTSNRPTQKPQVQQNMQPKVPVNLSTRTQTCHLNTPPTYAKALQHSNHRILHVQLVNARRAEDNNRS